MSDITTQIDVYDSEIPGMECALKRWEKDWGSGRAVNLENARKALIEMMAETRRNCTQGPGGSEEEHRHLGYVVDVLIWSTNVEGVIIPEVVIKDRVERLDDDPDRMVYEVTNDILSLGEGGVISTNGGSIHLPGRDN